VLLVAIKVPVSLIVCSLFAAIGLVLKDFGLEVRIFPGPQVHQGLPTARLSIAPFWTNLRNENISIQEQIMQFRMNREYKDNLLTLMYSSGSILRSFSIISAFNFLPPLVSA
jgi:hypothetical protein